MLSCEDVQAALSARIDGEPTGVPDDVIDAHLSGCLDCQNFFERATALGRLLTFQEAGSGHQHVPDLTESILAGVEPVRRKQAARYALSGASVRVLLGVLGCVYVGWALSTLGSLAGVPGAEDPVLSRLLIDAVAFRLALAFGLFFAAWRPSSAAGLFPVCGALAMFSVGFRASDIVLGQASLSDLWGLALLVVTALAVLAAWLTTWRLGSVDRFVRSVSSKPLTDY